jgi:hypothetical protein
VTGKINKQNMTKEPVHNDNGIVKQDHRLYIPSHNRRALISTILHQYHDDKLHIGIDKTSELIKQQFYWNNMNDDIVKYIKQCLSCMKMKPSLNKPNGLLQSHLIPCKPWQVITVDFVTGLPLTKHSNDSFAVVVDKFSKMTRIIPMKTTDSAQQFSKIFFNNIVRLFGHPHTIISDRDSKFTSKFWECLNEYSRTKLIRSSAYRPQTDGQTEKSNQTIENMLRSVVNERNDDWDDHIAIVEYTINSTPNASTKHTPFDICYTYTPQLGYEQLHDEYLSASAPAATRMNNEIIKIHESVKSNLLKSQQRQ